MTVNNGTESGSQAGRREWIGLAVLGLPTLLLSLDMNVLYLALPHLGADLDPSSTETLWIMDIYGFMIAGFLVTMGTLGDRIGRRKLLMIGATAFGIASVLAAYSTSAEMLIATRALLGIAGATLMPSTLALISNMFRDPKQRTAAIGVWMTCFMIGTIIGPLVGGLLLNSFWWGSVFLLGVPVMVLLLVTAPLLLPEYRDAQADRIDLISVALSLAAMLPVIYGLKELATGYVTTTAIVAIVVGLAFGVVFARRQLTLASPLLDLGLFGRRSFSASLGIMLMGGVIIGGTYMFFTQYLQMVEGLSALGAGLWLLPPAGTLIVGSMLAPAVVQRVRPAYVLGAGMVIATAGFVVLTQVSVVGGLATAVTGFSIVYFGFGAGAVLGTDLIVGSAPPEKAGSASSMSETSTELGVALGVAVLGSVGTVVYRGEMAAAVPAGVPGATADAARETITGAVAAAEELPGQLSAPLLAAAREAFTTGFNITGAIGAVIGLLLAVLCVTLIRQVRIGDEPKAEDTADTAPTT